MLLGGVFSGVTQCQGWALFVLKPPAYGLLWCPAFAGVHVGKGCWHLHEYR